MSYLHGIERVELADGVLAGKRGADPRSDRGDR